MCPTRVFHVCEPTASASASTRPQYDWAKLILVKPMVIAIITNAKVFMILLLDITDCQNQKVEGSMLPQYP